MSDTRDPATDQQLPHPGKELVQEHILANIDAWEFTAEVEDAIKEGIKARRELGIRKYGTPLMTHNGRDTLKDAWEEALDLFTYLTQLSLEAEIGIGILEPATDVLAWLTASRLARGDTIP